MTCDCDRDITIKMWRVTFCKHKHYLSQSCSHFFKYNVVLVSAFVVIIIKQLHAWFTTIIISYYYILVQEMINP
jgi:hypothetical protein